MRFCDVSLPVPLDQVFTYSLPETLQHRVQPGCRVFVPFGARKLTGVVLALSDDSPDAQLRDVLRLIDEEPVLDCGMIALGRWIAAYYCAPLGEVLRTMTPLTGELRSSKVYELTDSGRDAARQLMLTADDKDPVMQVMRLLEGRPLTAPYIKQKVPNAANALRSLQKKGFIQIEDIQADRDPMRASAARLRVQLLPANDERRTTNDERPPKWERELLAYLDLHPGSHNLAQLVSSRRGHLPKTLYLQGNCAMLQLSGTRWHNDD